MRKLNTLLTALALALGLATGWAQTDVTSKITNADFSSTDGWTAYVSKDYKDIGNGQIGTFQVNSNGGKSTTDDTHLSSEYCFGFEARWDTNFSSYYQEVELAAGTYTLSYDLENTNTNTATTTSYYTSYCYVSVGDTKYTDDAMEWTSTFNTWTNHTINFTLDEESKVKISLGYYVVIKDKVSSKTAPCLYASHLKLQRYESLNIVVNDAEMTEYDSDMPEYSYKITDSEGNTCAPSKVLSTTPTLKATYTKDKTENGTTTSYTTDVTTGSAPGIYPITATDAVAAKGYAIASIAAGKLTIKAKEYGDVENNLEFKEGDALTENVTSYDYDTALNETTRSGLQTVPGWEANEAGNTSNGNARAGGLVAYDSKIWFGGSGNTVPSSDDTHTGNALAVVAVWEATASYSTTCELPAGQVTITIPVYNKAGKEAISANLISVKIGEETQTASTTQYAVGEWTNEVFTFNLKEKSTATITLGYTAAKKGNNDMPHLFFDGVTYESKDIVYVKAADVTVNEFEEFESKLSYTATDVDGNSVTLKTNPTLSVVATYGSSVIAGSDDGEYKINLSGAESDDYAVVYEPGKLTITEATHSDALNLELTGNTIVDGVVTYAKDRYTTDDDGNVVNDVTRSGLQPIDGWTASQKDHDGMAGGLYAVSGETVWLGSSDFKAPAAYDGETNVIGIMNVWNGDTESGDGSSTYTSAAIDLEVGNYTLTIPVYNAGGTGESDKTFTNATGITVDGTSYTAETSSYTESQWTLETIKFTVKSKTTGNIVVGFAYTGGSDAAPHLFYGVPKLERKDFETITLDETSTTDVVTDYDGKTVNVNWERTIIGGIYNAVCLPFALSAEDITATFGEGAVAKTYTGDSYDSSTDVITLTFTETTDGVKAGVPFIVMTSASELASNTFTGKTIEATTAGATTVGKYYNLHGTFAKYITGSSPLTTDDYIMGTSGKWGHPSANGNSFKGYRAYIKLTGTLPSQSARVAFDIDGKTTFIDGIIDNETANGDIYNLRGQKVNRAQKGVYIVNGKKKVIK